MSVFFKDYLSLWKMKAECINFTGIAALLSCLAMVVPLAAQGSETISCVADFTLNDLSPKSVIINLDQTSQRASVSDSITLGISGVGRDGNILNFSKRRLAVSWISAPIPATGLPGSGLHPLIYQISVDLTDMTFTLHGRPLQYGTNEELTRSHGTCAQ